MTPLPFMTQFGILPFQEASKVSSTSDNAGLGSRMSIYARTIKSITEVRTVVQHMSALGKILAETEDSHLYGLIQNVVLNLQWQMQQSIGKPVPTSLMFFPTPPTVHLHEYCKHQKQSKKAEWQVLAERNGWSPPDKKKS